MNRAIKAYPALLRVGFASAVAYRAEFLIWMFSTNMPLVMLAIWAAVARSGPVAGYSQRGFTAYYIVTLLVRLLTGSWVVWEMTMEIRAGTLALARARYDELLADYRQTVVQAFTDVENAITAYRFATEQEALERVAVATAQRAADIARAQLLAGTVDIVTALQAQTALFSDLDLLAQVRLLRFQALLSLYKALGGGWSRADITAPAVSLLQDVP